jgi:hypothetical protein
MIHPKDTKMRTSKTEAKKISPDHLILDLLSTTQQTSPPGSDETSLLTLCSISRDSRSLSDMLMVTTLLFVSFLGSSILCLDLLTP